MEGRQAHALELINTIHPLGLLLGVNKAAKSCLELLAARPVGHATQTRAVPVNLAGLRVERCFLACFFFEVGGVHGPWV